MKGVVFTEFFEFVEREYSPEFLQETIAASQIASGGVYTSVGTYPVCEMGALHFFEGINCPFELLASVETKIHVDVKKLYPDAELPTFEILEHSHDRFVMNYKSARGLGDLCEGLIEECLLHFGKPASISRELKSEDPVTVIQFTLQA